MEHDTDHLHLLEALSLAVLVTDTDGVVTFANGAAAEMFAEQGLLGRLLVDLLGPDPDGAGGRLPLADVLAGAAWRGDLTVSAAGRDRVVVSVSATPVRDPGEGVVGTIVALDDTTEVHRARVRAAESEQRLRLAHAAARLGIWHWNAVDGTNIWDEHLQILHGFEPGSFDGTWDAWLESVHPGDRERVLAEVDAAIEAGGTFVLRYRVRRRGGRPRWVEANGRVLIAADGTAAGTIGCVQDVTDRLTLERRVAEVSEELQRSLAASPLPELDRFDLAAWYAPGGDELEHVGGDWYDAVGTVGGGLVLVVGDVMGRGVGAATTMIHVRAGIRGLLAVESDPAALLEAADDLVARHAPEQFVTAVAVLVDPVDGSLTLASAGHVPVIVLRADGSATVTGIGSGPPLGVLAHPVRTVERLPVDPGSTIVLVTDGVVESRDHDIDEGIELLRRRAVDLHDRPLDELVAELATLADARLRDDVTVVAARLR